MFIVQNLENAKKKVKKENKIYTESHTVPRSNITVNIFLDYHLLFLSIHAYTFSPAIEYILNIQYFLVNII